MTKTKLWISPDLELRHSLTGWPVAHTEGYAATDMYADELAQAKKDSIPVDVGSISGWLLHVIMNAEPDTFVDYEGEVGVIWQYYAHEWMDCIGDPINYMDYMTRQVARLKPSEMTLKEEANLLASFTESGAMSYTEGHELMRLDGPGAPMIQNDGLKARILDAFNAKWMVGEINSGKARKALSEVLDELNIK